MSNIFLRRATQIGFSLTLLVASGAVFLGHAAWALGALTAACWMFLNIYFLFRLLAIGLKQEEIPVASARSSRVLFLSVLKFPVIYLAGYFILKTRYFPIESILAGLTAFVAGIVVAWILWQRTENRGQKTEEKLV